MSGADALVIIPTYNECDNVREISRSVESACPGLHILFVDDGSPDGTGEILDELAAQMPHRHVLHRPGKLGLGSAYVDGFRWGLARSYQYLLEMDADFSHDPRYLTPLIEAAQNGADVAIGSRYVEGGGTVNWGIVRQIISRAGGFYARTILGFGVRDPTAGFICYRRACLEAIDLGAIHSNGYSFQIEMKYRAHVAGCHLVEVPIVFEDRRVGQSKMSSGIVVEALATVWKLKLGRR